MKVAAIKAGNDNMKCANQSSASPAGGPCPICRQGTILHIGSILFLDWRGGSMLKRSPRNTVVFRF